jgi:CheY-like chemotaxis protein/anti-sigma regulatory factor (Ser/Thr protein kinase)
MAERARAVIGRQVKHLSRLVDDLLDVSRMTTGKVVLARRPMDLAELVRSAVAGWRASGRFDRHTVEVQAAPAWIDADETRMEQVLSNLVGNALKYTPAGGLVTIRVAADDDVARLEVADTGAGIPDALIEKVFDLFVQGERTLDRAEGGLGIGLTLVKLLVRMHGGTVSAQSEGPGHGAVFTVRLPRVVSPAPPSPARPSGAGWRERRRILLVEDNADAREMLRFGLTLQGHEVHEAGDGPAAVELAATVRPDIAFVDIGLPGIDGYEVARRIRATEGGKSIYLVAITGYGQAEDRRRAQEAGFDAHETKPVLSEQLGRLVEATRAPRTG